MSACLSGACFLHLLAPQWLHRTPLPDVLALPPYLTWVLSSPCPAQVLDVLDRLFVHMFQVGRQGCTFARNVQGPKGRHSMPGKLHCAAAVQPYGTQC